MKFLPIMVQTFLDFQVQKWILLCVQKTVRVTVISPVNINDNFYPPALRRKISLLFKPDYR